MASAKEERRRKRQVKQHVTMKRRARRTGSEGEGEGSRGGGKKDEIMEGNCCFDVACRSLVLD